MGSMQRAAGPSEPPTGSMQRAAGPSESPTGSMQRAAMPSESPMGAMQRAAMPSEPPMGAMRRATMPPEPPMGSMQGAAGRCRIVFRAKSGRAGRSGIPASSAGCAAFLLPCICAQPLLFIPRKPSCRTPLLPSAGLLTNAPCPCSMAGARRFPEFLIPRFRKRDCPKGAGSQLSAPHETDSSRSRSRNGQPLWRPQATRSDGPRR